MKRMLLIGRIGSGKTTLCQALNDEALQYYKTQTIHIVDDRLIDTPGEYLEMRGYRGALSVAASQADVIGLVQDATEDGTMFPPSFHSMFSVPTIGIVTKTDLAGAEQTERAKCYLQMAGALRMFETSSLLGEGLDALKEYLEYDRR